MGTKFASADACQKGDCQYFPLTPFGKHDYFHTAAQSQADFWPGPVAQSPSWHCALAAAGMVMVMESVFFHSNKLTKPVECGENRPVEQVHGGTHTRGQGSFFSHLPAAALQHAAQQALIQKQNVMNCRKSSELIQSVAFFSLNNAFFSSQAHTSPFQKNTACACSPKTQIPERAVLWSLGTGTLLYFLNTSPAPWGSMTCISRLATPAPSHPSPRPPKSQWDITQRTQQRTNARQLCSSGGSD